MLQSTVQGSQHLSQCQPTDCLALTWADHTELLSTLGEVESLITSNVGCEVVWAAELTYDMSRNNHFTRTVTVALEMMGLTLVWQDCPKDHTQVHTDDVSRSVIDPGKLTTSGGSLGMRACAQRGQPLTTLSHFPEAPTRRGPQPASRSSATSLPNAGMGPGNLRGALKLYDYTTPTAEGVKVSGQSGRVSGFIL